MADGLPGLPVAEMDFEALAAHEWLCANSIGGYASSTAASLNTRRYHGILVAAMAPPVRRMVLLSRLEEAVRIEGREFYLACNRYPGTIWPRGHEHLSAFSADPFPRWAYQGDGWTLLKQLRLLPGENTVVLSYTLLGSTLPVDLELRPLLALRGIHELSYQWNGRLSAEPRAGDGRPGDGRPRDGRGGDARAGEARARNHWRVGPTSRTPEVFFAHDGTFDRRPNWYLNSIYRREQERGYPALEDLWSPGAVYLQLPPGQTAHFACSAEPFDLSEVVARAGRLFDQARRSPLQAARSAGAAGLAPEPAEAGDATAPPDPVAELLCRAGEPFVLKVPGGRGAPIAVAGAGDGPPGDSPGCTIKYPWNAPSARLALAGINGLMLIPGRHDAARSLLLVSLEHLDDGLLPSEFPEDGSAPLYKGADVSLWFVYAVHQYLAYTVDEPTVRNRLLPAAWQIVDAYRRGTGLGIRTDADGLLASGTPGAGTTWMDAKVGDWVVTPRHGRAVEMNALWYNALCAVAEMSARLKPDQGAGFAQRLSRLQALTATVREAFNRRFWNESAGCCYDVVGDAARGVASAGGAAGPARPEGPRDASLRPNQLWAISLPFPVLAADRFALVVKKVRDELLIPTGVRTLSRADPAYQGHYGGNVIARDRAYHNGSAFPFLLGPLVTATVRAGDHSEPARAQARLLLEPCLVRLQGAGLGLMCELFDGDAPHTPGGALAEPWAVAEIYRSYVEDVLGRKPGADGPGRGGVGCGCETGSASNEPAPPVPRPAQ